VGSAVPSLPADVVLDTSVIVAWAFHEASRYTQASDVLSDVMSGDVRAHVPDVVLG
jgi:predicted nucleic acid-binding protein